MVRRFKTVLVLIAVASMAGCASHEQAKEDTGLAAGSKPTSTAAPQQRGECLVCKHNADLACVDVPVDADTPRLDYNGKTYYFCSEACKSKFEKDPQKYIEK